MPEVPRPRHGLARVLSKRGLCSRTQAATWIRQGRVAVDGVIVRDPEHPVAGSTASLNVDGQPVAARRPIHLMLNKPRGLVTTASDERGRDTVYGCLDGWGGGWLAPVGRLDKASEGLLLFSNDPGWAARITDPRTGPAKTYHVQVDAVPDPILLEKLIVGVESRGEHLAAQAVRPLRAGGKNAWLEIVLDEGRNRQIRRLLEAHALHVLRLVRVAIGNVALGDLPKGKWRLLSEAEAASLAPVEAPPAP